VGFAALPLESIPTHDAEHDAGVVAAASVLTTAV
jgi:hypothetical protein